MQLWWGGRSQAGSDETTLLAPAAGASGIDSTVTLTPGQASSMISPPAKDIEPLLSAYHAQGLIQSRVTFWFSVVFASLGFAIIAATVVNAVASSTSVGSGELISLISGTIVEAVSALFFVQSNRARVLMTGFFDRLRADRALDRALQLAEDVPDELVRSRLKAVLAFGLAGAQPTDDVARMVLGVGDLPIVAGSDGSVTHAQPK